jgi:uncharacterized protein
VWKRDYSADDVRQAPLARGGWARVSSLEPLWSRRDDILRIAIRHGAHNVRVFGSVARDEATEDSDVDFLVSARETTSPWFPAGLVLDLDDFLGCRVQVVTEGGLYSLLKRRILGEAVPLLETLNCGNVDRVRRRPRTGSPVG